MSSKTISLFDGDIMRKAVADSFIKLNPRQQLKNPVMFVTLSSSRPRSRSATSCRLPSGCSSP